MFLKKNYPQSILFMYYKKFLFWTEVPDLVFFEFCKISLVSRTPSKSVGLRILFTSPYFNAYCHHDMICFRVLILIVQMEVNEQTMTHLCEDLHYHLIRNHPYSVYFNDKNR